MQIRQFGIRTTSSFLPLYFTFHNFSVLLPMSETPFEIVAKTFLPLVIRQGNAPFKMQPPSKIFAAFHHAFLIGASFLSIATAASAVRFEAEDATRTGNVVTATDILGFTGTGYMAGMDNVPFKAFVLLSRVVKPTAPECLSTLETFRMGLLCSLSPLRSAEIGNSNSEIAQAGTTQTARLYSP